jgi:NAD+ kinase
MSTPAKKRNLRVAVVGRHLEELHGLLRRFSIEITNEKPDVVISHGGDGSLLGAERLFPGVPKCPIRDRRMNPKCEKHTEEQILQQLVEGSLSAMELIKLEAVTSDNRRVCGINDLILSKENIASAVRFRLWLDGELYSGQIVGDGLVAATPFGSTGYYQSITHGSFRVGVGLAFNNSMDLLDHVVVAEDTRIEVELLRGPAVLLADNDPTRIGLRDGDRIIVRRRPEKTRVYGIDIFRCPDCFHLRRDGITSSLPTPFPAE